MKKKVPFMSHRNYLFAKIGECQCLSFPDNPNLTFCKKDVRISGYNDDYFFDVANGEPHEVTCPKCGFKALVQWFRDEVEVEVIHAGDQPTTTTAEREK